MKTFKVRECDSLAVEFSKTSIQFFKSLKSEMKVVGNKDGDLVTFFEGDLVSFF